MCADGTTVEIMRVEGSCHIQAPASASDAITALVLGVLKVSADGLEVIFDGKQLAARHSASPAASSKGSLVACDASADDAIKCGVF